MGLFVCFIHCSVVIEKVLFSMLLTRMVFLFMAESQLVARMDRRCLKVFVQVTDFYGLKLVKAKQIFMCQSLSGKSH